ncbi:MAG: DNA polymerase III subunit alpha, partial [Firmicutes bacterium]|nr:DNA polymerase III subunit alpha [Bacillota bacterium]
ATNDVHYINQADAKAHDVLLCIQTTAIIDDEKRMRFPNDQFYLKSEKEMRTIFARFPEALDNTQKIAEQCNVEIEFGNYHLPEFIAPDGKTNLDYFHELCEQGISERYGIKRSDSDERATSLYARLDHEMAVIEQMGYVEYFLIVWDFINYAREHDIAVGPGRGSAAGSIVAYSLHITNIDPIKYNLIFERFLNPERVSMPDIDVDFCYERRGEVIDYVIEKYGAANVSQIITFGTMKAKQAVRDVARTLKLSYADADVLAKAIPDALGMTIAKAIEMNPALKEKYENEPSTKEVLDMAMAIEGMPRNAGTHAAGVVISRKALDEYVPLYMSDKGRATQFTMTTIEELGLLKMDFLGLRTLTVIRDAVAMIKENHGVEIDINASPYDDPKVFETIASGNTCGVFQLESGGMTSFMKTLAPDCFEDIIAGISLYRPGPMDSIPRYIENKKMPAGITYIHDLLRPILDVTYGCLVYQEQVMQTVRELAGFSYGRSDELRRAMSKKKLEKMLKEKENFINGNEELGIDGCLKRGVPKEAAEEIFNQMVSFAEYAFNKSHAAAYAVVAYQTAYLKTYYPVEFMAALISSVMGDAKQVAKYIRNCTELGIKVLPPSVLESRAKFTVKDGAIRFGLLGVKGVGMGPINAIIKAREERGMPKDIFEFISNLDIREVNKKAIESLIKAGALDDINPNRAQHLAVYERLIEAAQGDAKKNIEGQMDLFSMAGAEQAMAGASVGTLPDLKNFEKDALLAMEKEMLGIYVSDHPLNAYRELFKNITSITTDEILSAEEEGSKVRDGMKVVLAGMVSTRKTLITKSQKMMAFLEVEDLYGSIEVVVFPNVYEKFASLTEPDSIIKIEGTVNFKEEKDPAILADKIEDVRLMEKPESPVCLRIAGKEPNEAIEMIRGILESHPGKHPVKVYLDSGKGFRSDRSLWVEPDAEFVKEITDLIGKENVKISE